MSKRKTSSTIDDRLTKIEKDLDDFKSQMTELIAFVEQLGKSMLKDKLDSKKVVLQQLINDVATSLATPPQGDLSISLDGGGSASLTLTQERTGVVIKDMVYTYHRSTQEFLPTRVYHKDVKSGTQCSGFAYDGHPNIVMGAVSVTGATINGKRYTLQKNDIIGHDSLMLVK